MMPVLLVFWIASSILILLEQRIVRILIYLGLFSLLSSVCFLLYGAPDVALAEAVVSTFSTIIFIVSFEKYDTVSDSPVPPQKAFSLKYAIPPFLFVVFLFALFVGFMPDGSVNTFLKDQYLSGFAGDVGGENAVTAIYLGYRMYDTLFEALMLLISIVAIMHLSWHTETFAAKGKRSDLNRSPITVATVRLICPVIVLFGVYLIMNGHISPGGGFQGGVMLASFFIGRYIIYDIYDIRIGRIINLEKLIYVGIVLVAVFFILLGNPTLLPVSDNTYLILMNALIGLKVSCGFLIIFYRFIALERR